MNNQPDKLRTVLSKYPISYILTLIISALLIVYLYERWDEISTWLVLRPEIILAIIALAYLSTLLGGQLNQIITSHFNLDLPKNEWVPLTFVVTALNTILPFGSGAAARATYLKKKYKFTFTNSSSGFLFSNLIAILTNACLGLCLTVMAAELSDKNNILFMLTFTAITVITFIVIAMPSLSLFKYNNRLLNFVTQVHAGLTSLKKHKTIILQIIGLTLSNTLLYGFRLYLAFLCIDQPPNLIYCLIGGVLASLSLAFSFTPGGIGLRESILVIAGMAFGINIEHALIATTLERIVTTASIWLLIPFCLHHLKLKL